MTFEPNEVIKIVADDDDDSTNMMKMVKSHKMNFLIMIIITLVATHLTNLTKQEILSKNYLVWSLPQGTKVIVFLSCFLTFLINFLYCHQPVKISKMFLKDTEANCGCHM